MTESESVALPLGDTPVYKTNCITVGWLSLVGIDGFEPSE